jgi:hypothetical protein
MLVQKGIKKFFAWSSKARRTEVFVFVADYSPFFRALWVLYSGIVLYSEPFRGITE